MEKVNEKKVKKLTKEEFYVDLNKKLEKNTTANQYVETLNKINDRPLKEKNEILEILENLYAKLHPSSWEFTILLFDKLYAKNRFDIICEFINNKAIQFFDECDITKQEINDFKFKFETGDFLTREELYTKFVGNNKFIKYKHQENLPLKEQKGSKEKKKEELKKERYKSFTQIKIAYSFILIAVEFSKRNDIYRDLQLIIIKNFSDKVNDENRREELKLNASSNPKTHNYNFISNYICLQKYDEVFETSKFLFNDILIERNQLQTQNDSLKKSNTELSLDKKILLEKQEELYSEIEKINYNLNSLKSESIQQQDIHNKTEQMLINEGERSTQIIKDTRIGIIRKVKSMLDLDLKGILEVSEYLEDIDKNMLIKYVKRINEKIDEIEEK